MQSTSIITFAHAREHASLRVRPFHLDQQRASRVPVAKPDVRARGRRCLSASPAFFHRSLFCAPMHVRRAFLCDSDNNPIRKHIRMIHFDQKCSGGRLDTRKRELSARAETSVLPKWPQATGKLICSRSRFTCPEVPIALATRGRGCS